MKALLIFWLGIGVLVGSATMAFPAVAFSPGSLVGGEAPNFTLTDVAGQVHTLHDYQGEYVVLSFGSYS